MAGQLHPKKELTIELKRTKPEQGWGFGVAASQSANIREIRGKDRFRG